MTSTVTRRAPQKNMVWVPGGTFSMGSDFEQYPEEGPIRPVTVDGFWMDATPVTVGQFRRFVKATGYETTAERPWNPEDYGDLGVAALPPGSLVFFPTDRPVDLTDLTNWWRYVAGANWAHPEGPTTNTSGREYHPVVHVTWEDVVAYAAWAGKSLPTEAEWERAARGGLEGATYTWGEEFSPKGRPMANIWVGEFPWQNLKPPALQRTSPVRSFPNNGYGLHDMAGNVWEWTSDFFQPRHTVEGEHSCCTIDNPRVESASESYDAGVPVARRVLKGGSHLCSLSYCQRYRPAARQAQMVDSSMSHVGFRCIVKEQ
jgi:sulfatase modifying factor 1